MATNKKPTKKPIKSNRSSKRLDKTNKSKQSGFNLKAAAVYGAALLAVLVILTFIGILNPVTKNTSIISSPAKAFLYMESNNSLVNAGDEVIVKVFSDSKDLSVNAVQSLITYPETVLRLDQIDTTSSEYPIEAAQNSDDNKITIVRGAIGGVTDKKLISELKFTAITSGVATITFDSKGSALVDSSTNQNVLNDKSYKNLTVEVQ